MTTPRRTSLPQFRLLALAVAAGAMEGATTMAFADTPVAARVTAASWNLEPGVVAGVFILAAVYWAGLRALRLATGAPAKLRRAAACYALGCVVLVVALLSPVHAWGAQLFSAHMVQHELLMVLAAPLLVLGRPALVALFALPRGVAQGVAGGLRRSGITRVWHALTSPFVATSLHAAALWLWHVPVLFEAARAYPAVHVAQHVSFLGTAIVFWEAVFFGRRRVGGYGVGVLYLFATAMQSGALGALLTFASVPWYAAYAPSTRLYGLSPIEDQQLGGIIMWIPGGLVYVVVALALFARWLNASDRPHVFPSRRPEPQPLG
jgi:putative membrane protein